MDTETNDPDLEMADAEETRKSLGYGFPEQEEKQSLIAFFKRIIDKEFNAKTANLTNDEMGVARLPVRSNMELANYCKMMNMEALSTAFMDDAQILLGTSLSREGFLAKLAVTTQKFSETSLTKQLGQSGEKKKGLFKKKETTPY